MMLDLLKLNATSLAKLMQLKGKKILILSPQAWGKMYLSKHHYAIALAERGNTVYFLNPPVVNISSNIEIVPSGVHPSLFLINYKLWFPYNIKFHALPLFHFLMKFKIRQVLKQVGELDVVWSFDLGYLYPLSVFPVRQLKIYHPVDEPLQKIAIDAAHGADLIFSVTDEILEKYQFTKIPSFLINHGVSDLFVNHRCLNDAAVDKIRVGFSGNLLRADLDRQNLLIIIRANPEIEFHLWGTYQQAESNIGGAADENQRRFVKSLRDCSNVILYGAVSSHKLVEGYCRMAAFLICYDIERDQSKGTNYHKIMEFLSFGKVIISNNVTAYKRRPDLIAMCKSRQNNEELPELFKSVISNLAEHNSPQKVQTRKAYALDNTYLKQLDRIERLIEETVNHKKPKMA